MFLARRAIFNKCSFSSRGSRSSLVGCRLNRDFFYISYIQGFFFSQFAQIFVRSDDDCLHSPERDKSHTDNIIDEKEAISTENGQHVCPEGPKVMPFIASPDYETRLKPIEETPEDSLAIQGLLLYPLMLKVN